MTTRCKTLDADGCRCLQPAAHSGPHDFPWTPWLSVVVLCAAKKAKKAKESPRE